MTIPTLPRYFPARYHREAWFLGEQFDQEMEASLQPGVSILDLGSGRTPALGADSRPAGCRYVGLDISLLELQRAPEGAYDEMFEADAVVRKAELEGRFDVVLSFQVLEHVKPLEDAFENMIAYLKPGGRLVAQMSGTFSAFGLLNQVLPQSLSVWALRKATRRAPESIFPAYYHHCWATRLERMVATCSKHEVRWLYLGGDYFAFFSPLAPCYLAYENWDMRGALRNLGSHYLVTAVR
jgi:SAM-dependent methyltransferase